MRDFHELEDLLAYAHVDDAVFSLRPDYRVLLLVGDGLASDAGGAAADGLLARAESSARDALQERSVEELPHVAAWRDAYREFGAKPQRTRNSLEALLRRAASGLPRISPLTDLYNGVSVLHQVPLGGEDLARYSGPPRLIRAIGEEPFHTFADGVELTEHPDPGEVVWCDDAGVTCRRWNWRQTRRTRLSDNTTAALFIFDALGPMSDDALGAAGDELAGQLTRLSPAVRIARRLITADSTVRSSRR